MWKEWKPWLLFLGGTLIWIPLGWALGLQFFADGIGERMVGYPKDVHGFWHLPYLFVWVAPPVWLWSWVWREPEEEQGPPRRTTFGSAAWATAEQIDADPNFQRRKTRFGVVLGTARFFGRNGWALDKNSLVYNGEAPLLTVGPTRSGKGACAIIPNLLFWDGSLVCVDPKGENASITARRRRELGQAVYVVDPWEETEGAAAIAARTTFNPLGAMANASEEAIGDLANIVASALIFKTGAEKDTHWNDSAENLLRGLVVHCLTTEPPERQTLLTVRGYITRIDFADFLLEMAENHACAKVASDVAVGFLQKAKTEEAQNVLSNLQKHLAWISNVRMQKSLAYDPQGLNVFGLKDKPTSVYLCIPLPQIEPMGRWLRLFVNLVVLRAMETKRAPYPLLFIIDEFPALGKLHLAERAVAEGAGYGLRLWPIVQDLGQLKALYGDKWETFIGNAGAFQVLGVNELFTAKYVSDLLGKTTVATRNLSTDHRGQEQASFGEAGRPLMTPDELMNMAPLASIVRGQNMPGISVRKIEYFAPASWRKLYDRNPFRS